MSVGAKDLRPFGYRNLMLQWLCLDLMAYLSKSKANFVCVSFRSAVAGIVHATIVCPHSEDRV